MIRARRAALFAVVCWGVAALWAPPASAATALTVTPNTDLVSGQVVTVEGSGFSPGSQVGYCQGVADDTPSSSDCGAEILYATASDTGTFTAQLRVRRLIFGRTRDCAVEACVIGAAQPEDIPGTVARAAISFDPDAAAPQPDARIKNRATGEIYGNDVYFPPGPLPTRRHAISPGGAWVFEVQVENDGPTDSFSITADASLSPFTVRYLSGYYDITAAATGAGATLRNMAPGQVRTIAVQFRAAADAPPGSTHYVAVRFTSLADGSSDLVQVGVKVPRST